MPKTELNDAERCVSIALANERYEEVQELLDKRNTDIRIEYRAIFGAARALAVGNTSDAWEEIRRGLLADYNNYELYMLLGDYYASKNLQQAYLCYENALHYCDVPEDRKQIQSVIQNLREQGFGVPKAAIVILSYNLQDMTEKCIESIRRTTPESAREIVVVDNASTDGSAEWLRKQPDIKFIGNNENQGFTKGCNQGIGAAEKDSDIFLLNNDTVMPDNALFWLRMGLYENEQNGSAGCVSNFVSNNQAVIENGKTEKEYLDFAITVNVPMRKPFLNKVYLEGFALLIKRTVLDIVGMLDERFSPGSFEDNDICIRISLANYRNVLCKNSFMIHWGSKSFGKEPQKYSNLMQRNERIFFEKWNLIGLEPLDYWNARVDIATLLEQQGITDEKIMVIGTGCGSCLSRLKDKFPYAQIYGVEQREYIAQIANGVADTVCVNLDEWRSDELQDTFDVIVINDSLENTLEPERVLVEVTRMLKRDGKMFISFENSNHFSRIGKQLGARRLFSRLQMREMLTKAKLAGNTWGYTQIETESLEEKGYFQQLKEKFPTVDDEELRAYQWVVTAEKQRRDIHFGNRMALCIMTYNHPETVEEVLSHCAELYKRYALDVYYFDSSENDLTKRVIEKYRAAGYDNLHYDTYDSKKTAIEKQEHVFSLGWNTRNYEYMWYMRDRCWCEENTLKLIYRGIETHADVVFMDVGHPNCKQELTLCNDVNAFYHRCGDYATSMDATIYNINTMLKNDLNFESMCTKYMIAWRYFFQFAVTFEQIAKIKLPRICLLAGNNVAINHSKKTHSGWRVSTFDIWGECWICANECLPDCYTDRDIVIKATGSLPWLLGDADLLIGLQQDGILTPEKYEKIKEYWERVSSVPLEVLRMIAYGTYQEYLAPLQLPYIKSNNLRALIQIYKAVWNGRMNLDKVSLNEIQNIIKKTLQATGNIEQREVSIIEITMKNVQNQLGRDSGDIFDILTQLQVYISLLMLIEKI